MKLCLMGQIVIEIHSFLKYWQKSTWVYMVSHYTVGVPVYMVSHYTKKK